MEPSADDAPKIENYMKEHTQSTACNAGTNCYFQTCASLRDQTDWNERGGEMTRMKGGGIEFKYRR